MNKNELIRLIRGSDILVTEFGYGCSYLKLLYEFGTYPESEVEVLFENIVYLKSLTDVEDPDCSLFVGESKFLDIQDFLKKPLDIDTYTHIKSRVDSGEALLYFWIEGEIYFEIICKKITYTFIRDGVSITKTITKTRRYA